MDQALLIAATLLGAVEYPRAVEFVPAHPNNYVPGGMDTPQYVIVHDQEGVYEGTISWFQYEGSDVSTQYVMRSIDGEITQMVQHADMAQHIGGWNPYAFGIEHEGYADEPGWYTWETYVESARLTRWLCDHYDIPVDREHILGHVEVPGATHTDPGPYWEWDLYMALVHDVVRQGRVEGVLVDRSAPCVTTAMEDTWITTTLEGLDALDDHESCFLAAGSELAYLHAGEEMASQYRLTLDDEGPCAGNGVLEQETFAWAPAFSPTPSGCDNAVSSAVMVMLDGVVGVVDAEGRFAFENVEPGAHTIDVASDGAWESASVEIDVEVYPGLRVVVPLDPGSAGSGSGGESEGGGEVTGGESGDEGDAGDAGGSTTRDRTTDTEADGETGAAPPLVPAGGRGDVDGCGCRVEPDRAAWLFALVPLLRRRRARSSSVARRR